MFRIGFKFSCDSLNQVKKQHYSKVYLTAKYYESQTRVKCEAKGRLYKDVKNMCKFTADKYLNDALRREGELKAGKFIKLTSVIVSCCFCGLLFFAYINENFQNTLEEYIPGIREAMKQNGEEEDFLTKLTKPRKSILESMLEKVGFYKKD